ncbi:MAG: hypothetical protein RSG51_04055, partial [Bacilli bacterium]
VNYVGSTAKTDIDAWYNNNITGANNNKVATWNVCNDKSTTKIAMEQEYREEYGAATRLWGLWGNKTPQFRCLNASDNIAVKGGLLTADEVAYAGGSYGFMGPDYYLYDNAKRNDLVGYWWVSSPCTFYSKAENTRMFKVYGSDRRGQLAYSDVFNGLGLRAVISLVSDTMTVSGDGAKWSPYEIQ